MRDRSREYVQAVRGLAKGSQTITKRSHLIHELSIQKATVHNNVRHIINPRHHQKRPHQVEHQYFSPHPELTATA